MSIAIVKFLLLSPLPDMPSQQLTNANAVANPSSPLKFLRWLAGSVFVVAAVLSCLIFAIQSRNRRKAENLLRDVQTIHVGKSKTEDVTNLLRNYRDTGYPASSSMCPSADSSYSVRIANDSLNQLGMKFPKLRKIGLKPWGVVAMFLLEHGKVCYFEYSFGLMRSEQLKELIVEVAAPPRVPGEEFEPYFLGTLVERQFVSLHSSTPKLHSISADGPSTLICHVSYELVAAQMPAR